MIVRSELDNTWKSFSPVFEVCLVLRNVNYHCPVRTVLLKDHLENLINVLF